MTQRAGPDYLQGAIFGVAAALIWASWSAVTRLAVTTSLDAWDITALRFGVAGLLLSPVLVRRGLALDRLGWLGLAVIIAGNGAPYALVAAGGLSFAPASDQGALNPRCMPLFVALIVAIFPGEKPPSPRKLGLSLMTAGAFIIFGWHGSTAGAAWSTSRPFGDALFLFAAFLTACFTVVTQQAKLDPLHAAALVSTGSLVIYLPTYLAFCGTRLAQMPLGDFAVQAIFQGVIVSVIALVLYGRAWRFRRRGFWRLGAGPVRTVSHSAPRGVAGSDRLAAIVLISAGVYLAGGGPLPAAVQRHSRER
jgi:drug/metabolite transporter (DMT)-like permease